MERRVLLLGCDAMQFGRSVPTFRRTIEPQFSGSKNKASKRAANRVKDAKLTWLYNNSAVK
jgi:hypothetical protein